MASTTLIGTAVDQVPTNGDLGSLAFQSRESVNFLDGVGGLKSLDITAISKQLNVTAVDVFVYDTSLDSDGGAWRNRCQHTSWYSEELNTDIRGSRREFPSVALIVAQAGSVTIYDADDPALPMWMVFLEGANKYVHTNGQTLTSIYALNASLSYSGFRLGIINFLSDSSKSYEQDFYNFSIKPLSNRNEVGATSYTTSPNIINNYTNDVAMTVLPSAPIDSTTGLPVPTIAVATAGGVSVIKDNGVVYNLTGLNWSSASNSLAFSGSILYFSQIYYYWMACDVTGLNANINNIADGRSFYQAAADTYPLYQVSGFDGNSWGADTKPAVSTNPSLAKFSIAIKGTYTYPFNRFTRIYDDNKVTSGYRPNNFLYNYTSSKYNTGWMHGDIRGCWLSDTTAETVIGTELVTNGGFDSGTTGWNGSNANLSVSGGQLVVTGTGSVPVNQNAFQNIAVQAGKVYALTTTIVSTNSSNAVGFNLANAVFADTGLAYKYYTGTFPLTVTEYIIPGINSIDLGLHAGTSVGATSTFDNVSIKLADPDRSVNGRGLQVFGNIVKTPVATGSDLVAYRGFTNTNYLFQPYNSSLDFGTGNFSYMFWINAQSMGVDSFVLIRGDYNQNGSMRFMCQNSAGDGFTLQASVRGDNGLNYPQVESAGWTHIIFAKRDGVFYGYRNGRLVSSVASTGVNTTLSSSTYKDLWVGNGMQDGTVWPYALTGSLALVKISGTAPTDLQALKIYEDENVLFQDNSRSTIYGTSDAVTALSYDPVTELLHVGTSSGRSVFQGLRRIDNTTLAVGAAISAVNNLVVDE